MRVGLRRARLSRNEKVEIRFVFFFPAAKLNNLHYYLVPFLAKKPDNIVINIGTKNAPYKNKDNIYKKLKSMKSLKNRQHPACKDIFISIPVKRLDNKRDNTILKTYVDKLTGFEVNSLILNDNILSSQLNEDGLHLTHYSNIKLAEDFISRIWIFWFSEGSYGEFKYFNSFPTQDTSKSIPSLNSDNDIDED